MSRASACSRRASRRRRNLPRPRPRRSVSTTWLADLDGQPAGVTLRRLFAAHPQVRALILGLADGSPHLWDLALRRSGAARAGARIRSRGPLRRAPRRHRSGDLLHARRSLCDAAPAPHEGGGVAVDRARRHRRRLAGDARHRRAHRARRCRRRRGGAPSARPGGARGQAAPGQSRGARGRQRLHRAGDGQDGRGRAQLFERHRPHRVLRRRRARVRAGHRAGAVLRAHHPRPGEAAAGAHRRRLCVPHRFAAAARSGLDPDRGLDRGCARLLREHRPQLGARRHDQGRAPAPATSRPARSCCATFRRSSGASISTSPPSPTSTA